MARTEDLHQFHGTACLCGFDSHGRSRSITEHIVEVERKRIAQAIRDLRADMWHDNGAIAMADAILDRIARSGGHDE